MGGLLHVNVLIALVDSDQVHHQAARRWFAGNHIEGWATCPITENGMVRVLSQPKYPSGQRTPAQVTAVLAALKSATLVSFYRSLVWQAVRTGSAALIAHPE